MDDLDRLAAQVRRSLHWAGFLVAMMALILVIDLQLKKSIARQAVNAARLFSEAVSTFGTGQSSPAADLRGGDDGADHMGGAAGMAAGADTVEDPAPAPGDGRVSRPAQRARRDGRGAGGPG